MGTIATKLGIGKGSVHRILKGSASAAIDVNDQADA